jgi:cytochrome c553
VWKSDNWLDKMLERQEALYQKFGAAGLTEGEGAHLLLWDKQMRLRDGKKMEPEARRRLELEIKDIAQHLKAQRPVIEQKPELKQGMRM